MPVLVFGDELVIQESTIKIAGDKILFLPTTGRKPSPAGQLWRLL
jgi:hypothetical protein